MGTSAYGWGVSIQGRAELVAEAEWQLLGKKLGKDMVKVRGCWLSQ